MSVFIGSTEIDKIYKGANEVLTVYKGATLLYTSKFVFNLTVVADRNQINVYNEAVAAGWDQTTKLEAIINIDPSVTVVSDSTGTPAFMTGNGFPAGSTITLVNGGTLLGKGGKGGFTSGTAGLPGGGALYAEYAITITNNNRIAGGGGGGAGAITTRLSSIPSTYITALAGGGGGVGEGDKGGAGSNDGTKISGGSTSEVSVSGNLGPAVARGGAGGAYGSTGGAAIRFDAFSGRGAGGYSISGDSFITWTVTGTRNGSIT